MEHPVDAVLDLLDRHVVDCDGRPVGKVDDLDFRMIDGCGSPVLQSLLIGPQALGRRLGGRLGRSITGAATRLAGTADPVIVPVEAVDDMGVIIRLGVSTSELEGSGRLEDWLRDHFIARIPGASRASG